MQSSADLARLSLPFLISMMHQGSYPKGLRVILSHRSASALLLCFLVNTFFFYGLPSSPKNDRYNRTGPLSFSLESIPLLSLPSTGMREGEGLGGFLTYQNENSGFCLKNLEFWGLLLQSFDTKLSLSVELQTLPTDKKDGRIISMMNPKDAWRRRSSGHPWKGVQIGAGNLDFYEYREE